MVTARWTTLEEGGVTSSILELAIFKFRISEENADFCGPPQRSVE